MRSAIPQIDVRGRRQTAGSIASARLPAASLRRQGVAAATSLAVFFVAAPDAVRAEAPRSGAEQYRSKTEKWVETRQILSEERADWLVERESLEATRELLRDERKALTERIAGLKTSDQGNTQERDQLLARREELQSTADSLKTKVAILEQQVRTLVPKLPEPLQKKLEPVLVQIPADPESPNVGLGQRLINVLAVVAQAEKWNGTATFVGETRDVGDGQKVAVRTLYWGLAQAVYVDSQGETAGIGRPSPEGWKFVDDPDLADSAKEILDIYEGIVDTIAFVPVPAEIQ